MRDDRPDQGRIDTRANTTKSSVKAVRAARERIDRAAPHSPCRRHGAAAALDRTIILSGARIAAIGGPTLHIPQGATVLDLTGRTVLPGVVGMHNHIFYIARPNYDAAGHSEPPLLVPQMTFSAPRLNLAAGVTTVRTAGSVEPYADLNLKTLIDAGETPGPHIDVTAPYLEGETSRFVQTHRLRGPGDARSTVAFGRMRARRPSTRF